MYSVVINCSCNNVAVKIVACWNWNVFTSSSWLDRHGEFVFTLHVRCDPPHSNLSDRPLFEWECNVTGRPILFCSLKLTFSTCFHVVVAQQWHGRNAVWGFGKRMVDGVRDEHHIFTEVTRTRETHSNFMQAVCTLLWIDCFETYMVVT